jgi:hypothetical protein
MELVPETATIPDLRLIVGKLASTKGGDCADSWLVEADVDGST